MNRHDLKLVCVSIAATLVCTLSVNTVLADTPLKNSIKSYGVFKFDYDDSDNHDDIVIDSSDLVTLANEIDTAKNSIGVVGKNLDKLVTVFDKMDEQGKDGKLFGTQIDSTDAGVLKIENVFANGVGNATASKVLKDYTFTSQYGLNIPGTIESLQASTITPGTKDQTLKAGFYLKGAQTIKGDTNLKAENILSGKSIFGVNGSVIAEVNSSAHTVPTGKTVSTAANILKNTTAWNGTTWVDGSMTNKSNSTTAASTVTEDGSNAKIQIPASGYYDANNSYITVPVETLKKEVSALNSSIFKLNLPLTSITTIEPASEWASNKRYGYKVNISNIYPNYNNLTSDNFIIELIDGYGSSAVGNGGAQKAGTATLTKNYDSSTGILTIDGTGHFHSYDGSSCTYNTSIRVYLVLSEISELS